MNHYKYLERVLPQFFEDCTVNGGWKANVGIIVSHGDKGYQYRDRWEEAGIEFPKAIAIYLLTYCAPYAYEVRETETGWVDVGDWVVKNYPRFAQHLPDTIEEDK
jgi:hypothetical protein